MEVKIDSLKIAIVTDWMLAPGGADRVLISLLRLFKDAIVYTSIYDKSKYVGDFKITSEVRTTFLQKFPMATRLHRHYNILAPIAFENLDFNHFDLIITLSAGPAKGIISGLEQKHLAIILTPPRTIWDGNLNVRGSRLRQAYKIVTPLISHLLRIWDLSTIERIDAVVSISQFIKRKVAKFYRIESDVIYPGLNRWWFQVALEEGSTILSKIPEKYFLVVSRLYDYKRIDIAITACLKRDKNLVIVGSGPDEVYLRKLCDNSGRITFLGNVNDNELKHLYANCEAFLFCGIEDFGLVPLEAMASGSPVLVYNGGGAIEIVEEGVTGELFNNEEELQHLLGLDFKKYKKVDIIKRAEQFSEERFHKNIISQINKLYER